MFDLRRRSLRLVMGLVLAALGLVETRDVIDTLQSQGRARERVVRSAREAVLAAHPRLAAALRPGGSAAWAQAVDEARRSSLADEFEIFGASGQRLLASPSGSPAQHWPSPSEQESLRQGQILTLGPITGREPRLLTYAAFPSAGQTVLMRVSAAVPDLLEDLRERRQALVNHGVALLALILAAGLLLFPTHDADVPPQRALDAYEAAMERLRDRGQALSREFEAERHRMEGEIQDKEAMARAGELAAGIAHEVRNGLATILGYARLLERAEAGSETASVAASIREECETLETVIRRFMDFVKRDTLDRTSFDLGRMLSRLVAREARSRPGAEVALPAAADVGTLVGDEELLERAFENLVRNAREAAGVGGHVVVAAQRQEGAMVLTVSDDGPGLPAEARQTIRPFFTTKAGGLGLGLPLALKIVRLHGGDLTLGENPPHGLAVTVRLPGSVERDVSLRNGEPAGQAG